MPQSSNIPISGHAWPRLGTKVDNMVKDFMADKKLPGMTVAVSKEGRLILSKGYGWAHRQRLITMEWDTRVKIGSVTKALVTGPAGWQLMKSKGIDSDTQTLYGPRGLFGDQFKLDIATGIQWFANDPNYDSSKWKAWYEKITIQNLLDHSSGFTHSGDVQGASQMFNTTKDKLTYEQAHKYILRTRPLKFEPGTKIDYSNHGFGLWTLLVKKMSGKSYKDYTREDYLQLIGLHRSILPERATPDSRDAWGHKIDGNGNLVPIEFKNSTLGLAAGGFMASARDMIRVMTYLNRKYTWEEINKMGWFKGSKDRLSHSGDTSGGTAFAVMFPDGFISNSGRNLSQICVALNTNIGGVQSLDALANNIALEVPVSGVPQHFDI
jgi:CubicO group peptidase (beta-lactamase class C family)